MLKKYIRPTIIVLIQVLVPGVLILILAPQLFQFQDGFSHVKHFFLSHKTGFLISHILLYLALIWLWPHIVYSYIRRVKVEITPEQIQLALKAKWYLLSALAFFELMFWWR